jgi:EAL domain-containing protein (putative c-di-GMP-specific phosphodiesterase class I)
MVSPLDFIPLTEEIGLIIPLGEWIIRTACAQAAEWPVNIKVAVNLSPVQFRSDNLVQTVFSALANSGIAASRLELEITESVLLLDDQSNLETLHKLRDMGVRIAMDDFGTGYSSLSYLRSFPFDKIKLDRSFISDLSEQKGECGIVDAVANMSRSLGMATTAEGVETEEQLRMVKKAGYTEVQGYLFSPPRTAAEITKMLYGSAGTVEMPSQCA